MNNLKDELFSPIEKDLFLSYPLCKTQDEQHLLNDNNQVNKNINNDSKFVNKFVVQSNNKLVNISIKTCNDQCNILDSINLDQIKSKSKMIKQKSIRSPATLAVNNTSFFSDKYVLHSSPIMPSTPCSPHIISSESEDIKKKSSTSIENISPFTPIPPTTAPDFIFSNYYKNKNNSIKLVQSNVPQIPTSLPLKKQIQQ